MEKLFKIGRFRSKWVGFPVFFKQNLIFSIKSRKINLLLKEFCKYPLLGLHTVVSCRISSWLWTNLVFLDDMGMVEYRIRNRYEARILIFNSFLSTFFVDFVPSELIVFAIFIKKVKSQTFAQESTSLGFLSYFW